MLLNPSGIAHGPVLPMMGKMVVPFLKYYLRPTEKTLDTVMETMGGKDDIFFPAGRVFKKAKDIFAGPIITVETDSKHLPSDVIMTGVCNKTKDFLKERVSKS